MKTRLLNLFLCLALLSAGPTITARPAPAQASTATESAWTFLVYMDGDNNLEEAALDDFMEMSSVGSDANVQIVVQVDRRSGYSTTYGDWTGTKRFHITPAMTPDPANAVQDLGELNMGDPQTLVDFVQWGRANYTATHYAVILWDHGDGWYRESKPAAVKAICGDDTSGGDYLDMAELHSALETITDGGADPVDLLGMDACLMAMIEVDVQLRPYALVRTSSEHTEPFDGYPYDTILAALHANPTWTPAQLADDIVNRYWVSYDNDETHSAADLGAGLDTLETAVDDLAQSLIAYMDVYSPTYKAVRASTQTFYYPDHADLYHFAQGIDSNITEPAINSTAAAVMDALDVVVTNERHGASWSNAHGVAIYFPTDGVLDPDYRGSAGYLLFTQDTQWDEFLSFYLGASPPPAPLLNCEQATAATCGQTYHGDTTGGTSNVSQYSCASWTESGPEDVYTVTVGAGGGLAITLSGMSVDLDLFLLDSCSEHACLRYSAGTSTEFIDWPNAPPGTYTIVVDGYNGAQGAYDLQIQCASDVEPVYGLNLLAAPSHIYVGETALLTATVFEKSESRVIADGTPITFTTSLGQLNPSLGHTEGGIATTTLSCLAGVTGTAHVTASLDTSNSATATVGFLGSRTYPVYLPLVCRD